MSIVVITLDPKARSEVVFVVVYVHCVFSIVLFLLLSCFFSTDLQKAIVSLAFGDLLLSQSANAED